jgi:hypothetical protein
MSSPLYQLLARLHWSDREREIASLLRAHWPDLAGRSRIVDVGCGPGWLARTATSLGMAYLGVDPSPPKGDSRFRRGTARDVVDSIGPGDIVVLNGVAHHLDDAEFKDTTLACVAVKGLIICDHARDQATPTRSRLMQRLDRGRHVRDLDRLVGIHGMRCLETRRFPIRLAGIAMWDYFAAAFKPEQR